MFETHKLNEKGFDDVRALKATMAEAVKFALALMPEGQYKSEFKTRIEEAMFFGTKAVAGKDGNYSEIIEYKIGQS